MTVGQRIKKRRKQLGLSADDLAVMIGKNRATIYRYESDEIENMPYDVITPLSKALNVSPIYLLGLEEEQHEEVLMTSYPFYDTNVAAGLPECVDAISSEYVQTMSLPDDLLGKNAGQKDIFLTRVNGESMNKVLPHNSLIAVKKVERSQLKNHDIVVFSHNHEYSVKRMILIPNENKIIFKPDSHDERFIDYVVDLDADNLIIHGKVVCYVVNLD